MTQVEKIKAEIERLQAKTSIGLNEYTTGYENGKAEVCGLLLGFIKALQAEPVSEDLMEAANGYAFDLDTGDLNTNRDTFIAGANWQKEQMMAKAIDGEVGYWNIRGLFVNMEMPNELEEGDKVKLVIVKED